ncbi:MAG: AbrB family transcriptional regulator [Deltaproteobacteria bacterium]|nr:MAG: AbrB family transcriptional regulator [Deltaproteobacteria bacterium]
MRSTITARGQTVVPAPIRKKFGLGPSKRLEWIIDDDTIRVMPVDTDPVVAFRGSGRSGAAARLLAERRRDRERE